MSRESKDIRRLVEVARLYYESGLTQERIAHLLHLSRPTVQRMVRASREQGIVLISIHDPLDTQKTLESQLQASFELERAVVVPTVQGDPEATKARVGEAGARYLETLLGKKGTLAVSWGTTVGEVAKALRPVRLPEIRVVQMLGDSGLATRADDTFRAIADRLGAQAITLPAPALEKNPSARRLLRLSSHIQEVFRILGEAQIALTGVGPVSEEATSVKRGHVIEDEMRRLAKAGAVGEINTKFYDRFGRPIRSFNKQIIGMDLDEICRIPRIITVASDGPGKAAAVLGAMRGHYIKVLITDESLARQVLASQAVQVRKL